MALRTSSTTARSSSHSTQSAPKKSSSAQRSGSASRSSAPTQSKQTSSAPKRDTFTRSTPTARQTPSKTSATSTAKTSTASKSSQAKTSTAKSNTTAKASSSKTVTKAKSNPTASKAKHDSFEFSSEAVKKSVQSAKSSKSSANSKAATKSSTKNSANAQTKKAVKNNSSNKNTISGSASKSNKSSKNKVPEGLKLHLQHTNDPKQKAGMRKTAEDYAAGKVVDQVSQKLKEFGIDLSALHTATTDTGTVFKLTKAKAYSIVPDGDKLAETGQYLTESDFQRIVNIMTHEAGSTQNANSEMFGIASVVLNEYEHIGFYDSGNYSKDTFTEFLDGFYELNSNLSTGGGMNIASGITSADTTWKQAEDILQYTLQGNRAFGSETCYWVGNSSGKYAGRVIGFSTQERGVVDTSGGVKGIDY